MISAPRMVGWIVVKQRNPSKNVVVWTWPEIVNLSIETVTSCTERINELIEGYLGLVKKGKQAKGGKKLSQFFIEEDLYVYKYPVSHLKSFWSKFCQRLNCWGETISIKSTSL